MRIIRDKKIREAIYRISANYIIAKDALDKAHGADKMSLERYADAIQHITDNAIESASLIGGLRGINLINEIIKKKVFNK